MVAPKLRAVGPNEVAEPRKMLSILEAAEADDRLEELRSMRRRIAVTLDDPNTLARDLAALSRRQIELGRDIDAIVARNAQEAGKSAEITDGAFDAEAI
jgi:hypothetical protein